MSRRSPAAATVPAKPATRWPKLGAAAVLVLGAAGAAAVAVERMQAPAADTQPPPEGFFDVPVLEGE